ncbi:glycosyltransferase [Acidianus sulfidivorans]|uniref:glycosyltransferase n=1 Tax=Acidianus sulfidivorans TaxID=312539 RepID=UPI0013A53D4F|nr:glycosyltransferase [Acidianus sulfidivorans]
MYCVYGTVYNNVNTVEDSIKSVWDPEYTIVITDNYSTDGTWEKLQELKKEYNLVLLRLKSTRGKGRDYALRHCPDNSITAYFDLDAKYNENFHKILKSDKTRIFLGVSQLTYIGNKEEILKYGGWKNYNVTEDFEFLVRQKIDISYPVIIGKNQRFSGFRDRRYAKGIKWIIRMFKNAVDAYRSCNYSFNDVLMLKYSSLGMRNLSILPWIIAKILGTEKYGNIDNITLLNRKIISTLEYPNGISSRYIGLVIDNGFYNFLSKKLNEPVERLILERIPKFKIYEKYNRKFFCESEDFITEFLS